MISETNQSAIGNPNPFDDKPICNKKTFYIPEYAENENPTMICEPQNPEPKPLAERLKKNIVKIKREALDELLGLVRSNSKEFEPYVNLATEFLSFNDQIIQDRSLKIIVLYINDRNQLKIDAKSMIKVVVEKCLTLQKEEIKNNSEEILFWYMDNNYEELLLTQLNEYLLHKNRKLVSISIMLIASLLQNYGIKRMKSLERFCKNLDLLSTPAKPIAKTQTVHLFKEVYRWIGQSCLKDFKIHAQIKDQIVKFGSSYQKVPMEIKRGLKKQPQRQGQAAKPVYYMQEEDSENRQPVDVLSHYTSQWVDNLLKMQKWKQKKDQLEQFIKKIKISNILPPRQSSHFIFLIKKLLTDNNINICYCGFYITQNLAKGLKKEFSHIAKNILSDVFAKLKDLKPMTVQLSQATLKSLLYSLTLQDIMENIKEGLNDKSPLMKEEVLKFLNNFFPKKDQKIMSLVRSLVDRIIQLTQDGTAKVRSIAFESLCTLKVTHGMKFLGEKVKNLDPKKMQTLELAKALPTHQAMQIEQSTLVSSIQPQQPLQILNKEQNTVKMKANKTMQVENVQKNGVSNKTICKNDDSSSLNSHGQPKTARSLNLSCLEDVGAHSEALRTAAYQQIANKFLAKDIKQFLGQIKANSLKQSSPTILKLIIQIAKKHVNNGVGQAEIVEYLLKHDWKKSKQLFQEFVQSSRFTPEADELIKSVNPLNSSTKIHNPSQNNTTNVQSTGHTLKTFTLELQNNLITKMSSPIDSVKKEGAEHAIAIWQSIPKLPSQAELVPSNGWNEQHISKFFNIIKFRLSQSNQEIASLYCRLLIEMINKGITVKHKTMKTVVQIVYNNLQRGFPQIKRLLKQMVMNAPTYMFVSMQSQICTEFNREPLVQFIIQHSDLFIKYADLKAFMNPFLHILCASNTEMKLKQSLDSLFNQMLEISGEVILQKQISKLKVPNIENYNQYLAKYNISLNKGNYFQTNSGKNFHIKEDRLKYWEQEQWQSDITSNHILKLANMMNSLGQPLSFLCNLFYLTEQNIKTLNAFQFSFLTEYSDILFKFIYWRSNIDCKDIIQEVLKFASRLIITVNYLLTEIDIILLMRSFINIVQRFKGTLQYQISEILKKLFKINSEIQNNTLQFWINFLMNNAAHQTLIDQILNIFMNCYEERLSQNLVQLARIPSVHKNQQFMKFLQSKCDLQHLTASGFRLITQNSSQKTLVDPKGLLSDLGGPENVIQIEASEIRTLVDMFLQNSQYLLTRITQITANIDISLKVEKHVKILYSIITPFYRGEISIINMFTYLKEFQKILAEPYQTKRTYLRQVTRMLLYLLVDLDQNPPNGCKCEEIIKLVNKCILTVIETSQVKHILQILFLLAKRHLQLNLSTKLIHLIIKCVGKSIKNNDFKLNLSENITYILEETNSIFTQFDIRAESMFIKTFKNVYFQLFKHYPLSVTLLHQQVKNNNNQAHQSISHIYEEFITVSENPPKTDNLEYSLKDQVKETSNIIKAMGTVGVNKLASIKKGQQTQIM